MANQNYYSSGYYNNLPYYPEFDMKLQEVQDRDIRPPESNPIDRPEQGWYGNPATPHRDTMPAPPSTQPAAPRPQRAQLAPISSILTDQNQTGDTNGRKDDIPVYGPYGELIGYGAYCAAGYCTEQCPMGKGKTPSNSTNLRGNVGISGQPRPVEDGPGDMRLPASDFGHGQGVTQIRPSGSKQALRPTAGGEAVGTPSGGVATGRQIAGHRGGVHGLGQMSAGNGLGPAAGRQFPDQMTAAGASHELVGPEAYFSAAASALKRKIDERGEVVLRERVTVLEAENGMLLRQNKQLKECILKIWEFEDAEKSTVGAKGSDDQ